MVVEVVSFLAGVVGEVDVGLALVEGLVPELGPGGLVAVSFLLGEVDGLEVGLVVEATTDGLLVVD